MSLYGRAGSVAVAGALVGAAALGYAGGYEVRNFQLRRVTVPVMKEGATPLTVLHISDLHMTPRQHGKVRFLQELAQLQPDLVVSTGDHLAHPEAVDTVLSALRPLRDTPAVFVLGSNDYYSPQLKNPARYLTPDSRGATHGPELPWRDLVSEFQEWGWLDLDNATGSLDVAGRRVAFVGVDDAHLDRDDYESVAGTWDEAAALVVGVSHAPYIRVLDAMADDGVPLIMAGHTHGGQLCIPGYGALVTNCDLDTDRVKGLSTHRDAWLHVSAGLGTSPYAPVRFACAPEATLLTLIPKSEQSPSLGSVAAR